MSVFTHILIHSQATLEVFIDFVSRIMLAADSRSQPVGWLMN